MLSIASYLHGIGYIGVTGSALYAHPVSYRIYYYYYYIRAWKSIEIREDRKCVSALLKGLLEVAVCIAMSYYFQHQHKM